MGTLPVIESVIDPRNIFTVVFYACGAKLAQFALLKQGRTNRALLIVGEHFLL